MSKFAYALCVLFVSVYAMDDEHQASRLQFVDSFQRNSPALNQLFSDSVSQSWKFGQLAAKGIQSELSAKSRNVLRDARKIATQHALNVRAEYQKLNKNVQQNLIGAVPMVKEVVANYATFKPIVDIVRKQLPNGFIATLTS